VTEQFREVFETWRTRTLPLDVDASAWNRVYRLAINTAVDRVGRVMCGLRAAVP
jgi:hypothetical protein